jgi:hypothetical protein
MDAGQHIGEPSLAIDVVQPRGVWISVYITAARSPPRSKPASSHDLRPSAMPRSSRSAALLVRQNPPVVEEAREGSPALEHVIHRPWGLRSAGRASRVRPASRIRSRQRATRARRTARRSSAVWPLISRSTLKIASMRLTAPRVCGRATGKQRRNASSRARSPQEHHTFIMAIIAACGRRISTYL